MNNNASAPPPGGGVPVRSQSPNQIGPVSIDACIKDAGYSALDRRGLYERLAMELAWRGIFFVASIKQWVLWDSELGCYQNVAPEVVLSYCNSWATSKPLDEEQRIVERTLAEKFGARLVKTARKRYRKANDILGNDLSLANSTLKYLSGTSTLLCDSSHFDVNPEHLNFRNGFIDLRTGTFTPHTESHGHFFRMAAACDYDPAAQCPRWLKFLDEAHPGDEALPLEDQIIPYLQYIAGTAAIGRMAPNRACFWIHGQSTTGKSVFSNTLRALLGGYATILHNSLLMKTWGEGRMANTLASIPGKRLVCINEVPTGQIDDTVFKSLTSTDGESVRGLYQQGKNVQFTHTLLTTTNHEPVIADRGGAVFMRLRPVPFTQRVEKPDNNLERVLLEEASGIMNWILEGAYRVLNEPDLYQTPPAAVRKAGEEYQKSMNITGSFIDECCDLVPGSVTATGSLFDAFRLWAKRSNQFSKVTKRTFIQLMAEQGYEHRRHGSSGSGRMHGFEGLAVNDEYRKLLKDETGFCPKEMNSVFLAPEGNVALPHPKPPAR